MSGLVLFGLWVAAKPADDDHPYGHGRFEILTGLAIGAILTIAGAGISWRAVAERNDQHTPASYALWPLIGATVLKAILWTTKMRIGKKSGSVALSADALNDAVDMCSGLVALIAVALAVLPPGNAVGGPLGRLRCWPVRDLLSASAWFAKPRCS